MKRKILISIVLMAAGAIGLNAQERETGSDTTRLKPEPKPYPMMDVLAYSNTLLPFYLFPAPYALETKQQRAARISQETYERVMGSVRHNLSWTRPASLSGTQKMVLSVAALFLTNPSSTPAGTKAIMSHPFAYVYTPGMEPVAHRYSPDIFPQCIRLEYDFKSGTYNQVMVKWEEVLKNIERSNNSPYCPAPVPRKRFTSGERIAP